MTTFSEIFKQEKKILSFEFFPPKKKESLEKTKNLMRNLLVYKPDFMTVTYGAGGGTREFTSELVKFIAQDLQSVAVSHLTCVGHTKAELQEIAKSLKENGIKNILALRGDKPQVETNVPLTQDFSCARELVEFLRLEHGFSDDFDLAVAGYPEMHLDAKNEEEDLEYLLSKQNAGASLIITQLFFEPELYFNFVEKAKKIGITVPIVPGLMPISNVSQVEKFTSMCGASIPKELLEKLKEIENDATKVSELGVQHAIKQASILLDNGAPGIHFYTLNKLSQIETIMSELGHKFS